MTATEVYASSDGEQTKRFYAHLQTFGPVGLIALNLFRAQKCSARAKVYRGGVRGKGSYKQLAYDRKSWSMALLCEILTKHAQSLDIVWGWKEDHGVPFGDQSSWVLYVELPTGQVSFHSPSVGVGPRYTGEWDKEHSSPQRIIAFCDIVMAQERKLAL